MDGEGGTLPKAKQGESRISRYTDLRGEQKEGRKKALEAPGVQLGDFL